MCLRPTHSLTLHSLPPSPSLQHSYEHTSTYFLSRFLLMALSLSLPLSQSLSPFRHRTLKYCLILAFGKDPRTAIHQVTTAAQNLRRWRTLEQNMGRRLWLINSKKLKKWSFFYQPSESRGCPSLNPPNPCSWAPSAFSTKDIGSKFHFRSNSLLPSPFLTLFLLLFLLLTLH